MDKNGSFGLYSSSAPPGLSGLQTGRWKNVAQSRTSSIFEYNSKIGTVDEHTMLDKGS